MRGGISAKPRFCYRMRVPAALLKKRGWAIFNSRCPPDPILRRAQGSAQRRWDAPAVEPSINYFNPCASVIERHAIAGMARQFHHVLAAIGEHPNSAILREKPAAGVNANDLEFPYLERPRHEYALAVHFTDLLPALVLAALCQRDGKMA
jgi:hypothetical protein